ncbi:MAG: hypothetical protein II878_02400, partial [Bacteroidales bacterium]|nr:hypothetical protein [Bacteroidales bacterium]
FQALPYNVKKDKGSKELQDFLKTHPEDKAKYEENERYNQWQAQAPSPIETTRIVSEKLNKFFDEKDVKFFKTKDGEAYGFTVGGKVYVDERIADASTPIHEYTHLWAEALRKVNPKEWQNIVSLMKKQTHLWDKVKNDYPELKTDDEIADEVLAHYSGERGKKLLDEEYNKIRGNNKLNIFDKAKMLQAINNVREALRKFWKGVADFLGIHFTSAEEVADKVLSDLLEGVNPNEVIKMRDKAYMEAVERGDMETVQRMVEEAAEEAMPNSQIRDKEGKMLLMSHHTDTEGFTVFDRTKIGTGQGQSFLGLGFNFSRGQGIGIYGKRNILSYLNAKHPLRSDEKTLSKTEIRSIIQELNEKNGEDRIEDSWGSMKAAVESLYEYGGDLDVYATIGMTYSGDYADVINAFEKRGFDSTIEYDDDGNIMSAVVFNSNQIKSADPVTYDDNGNVIPLSKRFDSDNADIRWKKVGGDENDNRMVNIVAAEKEHGFKNFDEANKWARKNIVGEYENQEIGSVNISGTAVDKYLSEKAVSKSDNKDVHLSALKVMPSIIENSIIGEIHDDKNGSANVKDIVRMYGAIDIDGETHRVKTTVKRYNSTNEKTKAYTYEVTKIELMEGTLGDDKNNPLPRTSNNSISAAKLLNNSETTKLKLQKVTERVVEKATDEALEEVKDPILKRAYKGILKESTKDKWASFADDYHALRVMEDKVIEEMRKRDPKFRLHHSVYEQQIAAKAATQAGQGPVPCSLSLI